MTPSVAMATRSNGAAPRASGGDFRAGRCELGGPSALSSAVVRRPVGPGRCVAPILCNICTITVMTCRISFQKCHYAFSLVQFSHESVDSMHWTIMLHPTKLKCHVPASLAGGARQLRRDPNPRNHAPA